MSLLPQLSHEEVQTAVQTYHDLGLTVIPVCKPQGSGCNVHGNCSSPGKVPIIKEWTKVFRSDEADNRIYQLFAEKNWDLNVGLLTGLDHNLYVIDVDGDEGTFSLTCENDMGVLPASVTIATGRVGGYHCWYRPNPQHGRLPKKINFIKKVDFIGEGGFVLAPPSVHKSGNIYKLAYPPTLDTDRDPLAFLADWTRDLVEVYGRQSNVIRMPLTDDTRVSIGQRTLTFLSQGATEGQREEAVHAVVNLLGRGIDRQEVLDRVTHALCDLSPQLDPQWPWTEKDVEKMIESFEKQGGVKPATALPELPSLVVSEEKDHASRVRDIFDALEETQNDEPLLEGIVYDRKCHVVFAGAGTGKTLFSLEILLHIAAGREWHGRRSQTSKVCLVEIDDTYQLRGYMESMRDAFGFTKDELGGRFVTNRVDDNEFGLENVNQRLALQAFVSAHKPKEGPYIVALDHLEGFLPKSDSFGSAKYNQFRQFKDWCKTQGITLWTLDHSLKGWIPDAEDGQPTNHLEALSGGQQKLAIFDVGFHMYGDLSLGGVTIWYAKLRDQKPDPFHWSFGSEGSKVAARVKNIYEGLTEKELSVLHYIWNHEPVSWEQLIVASSFSESGLKRLMQSRFLPRGLVKRNEEMFSSGPMAQRG